MNVPLSSFSVSASSSTQLPSEEFSSEARARSIREKCASGCRPRIILIPTRCLLGLIFLYRQTLSPILPAFLGPGCGCRFAPSCACYAMEAIQTHGSLRGVGLAAMRFLKCTPFHSGGYDPVPPRRVGGRPRCEAGLRPTSARPPRSL